jgi:CheY-like chemotaxis protein
MPIILTIFTVRALYISAAGVMTGDAENFTPHCSIATTALCRSIMLKNTIQRMAELKKLKVMIAEDHEGFLKALVRLMKRKFEIIAAVGDGRNLVDEAISLQPDVIVSDFFMPRLTGLEAQQELSARGYRIPFVLVSTETERIGRGSWSIVDKIDIPSELEAAVYAAASGKAYISRRACLHKE